MNIQFILSPWGILGDRDFTYKRMINSIIIGVHLVHKFEFCSEHTYNTSTLSVYIEIDRSAKTQCLVAPEQSNNTVEVREYQLPWAFLRGKMKTHGSSKKHLKINSTLMGADQQSLCYLGNG